MDPEADWAIAAETLSIPTAQEIFSPLALRMELIMSEIVSESEQKAGLELVRAAKAVDLADIADGTRDHAARLEMLKESAKEIEYGSMEPVQWMMAEEAIIEIAVVDLQAVRVEIVVVDLQVETVEIVDRAIEIWVWVGEMWRRAGICVICRLGLSVKQNGLEEEPVAVAVVMGLEQEPCVVT